MAIPDSTWQTGSYDWASAHQIKSEFSSQDCQVISVSKLLFPNKYYWLFFAVTSDEIKISVVYAMHDR